ncbi:MAG: hypothetical protein JO301_16085, partial [Chitinophagaceae bacterium]|nr:hypothetical protein [Chitinophagaceae bacterium]
MDQHSGQSAQFYELEEEQFSFRKLVNDWAINLRWALRRWKFILFFALAGALLALAYCWIKKTTYTARLTFVVEEAKSGGSLASALGGQLGIDLGGITGGSGILSGDNVLELLKSNTFIKQTLLSGYGDSASGYSLADQYITVYGWKEQWKKNEKVGKEISFPAGQVKFSRLEDSLLQVVIKRIKEKELSINKLDKKL